MYVFGTSIWSGTDVWLETIMWLENVVRLCFQPHNLITDRV